MKRLAPSCAFLLALMAGIPAWCLCASLIALISGSISSSLVNAQTPVPPPLSHSTTASMLVTNTDMRVSFRQPEGWTLIDSGTERNGPWLIPYAIYGLQRQPHAPALKITYQDSGSQTDPGDEDILVRIQVDAAHYRGEHVVEELRERIDGLPVGGIRYTVGRKVGFKLVASQPTQTNYFIWTSDVEYSHELEQIYRNMLPTIRIEPPPP